MKSPVLFLCLLLLSVQFYLIMPVPSAAAEEVRTCTVKEVLKGGMYVYIRCQENGKDLWLATVAREFKTDETVTFLDVPPMTDFHSKFLNRTFPEIIFADQLPTGSNKK